MDKILCSTGALIGRPNNRDYRLLKEIVPKLECDGIEFMVYSSWYEEFDALLRTVKAMNLNIPVVHCQKSLGEYLCGMKAWFDGQGYHEYEMTPEEDRANFEKGLRELKLNIKAANVFGAEKMVLHLWNGIPSDKRIEKNIERFGYLSDIASNEGVELMVENVLCNRYDPLSNMTLVHQSYPDAAFVFDTKMAEFHDQNKAVFMPENEWLFKDKLVKHLHINDYGGGYMDWANLGVLPIGKGHVDFDEFFKRLSVYGYEGDYTVEATAFGKDGNIDYAMLNRCFGNLRGLIDKYMK